MPKTLTVFLEDLERRTAYQSAMRKRSNGVELTAYEQALLDGKSPEELGATLCGCGCGQPLEPRIDGVRHTLGGREVNDDCYFEQMGMGIDAHSIGRPRRSRGG